MARANEFAPTKARSRPEFTLRNEGAAGNQSAGADLAQQFGFPIQVLADYTQAMNRYAFLLVE